MRIGNGLTGLLKQGYNRENYGRGAVPNYLRVQNIVEDLGVNEETVRSWIRRKMLPAIRIGRDYFIEPEDYRKFLEERKTKRDDNATEQEP